MDGSSVADLKSVVAPLKLFSFRWPRSRSPTITKPPPGDAPSGTGKKRDPSGYPFAMRGR